MAGGIEKLAQRAKGVAKEFSGLSRLHESEYRASIDALNLFFGAIVGVNFANLSDMPWDDYALLLFLTASLIALILIVSNTSRRIWSIVQLAAAMGSYTWLLLFERLIEGVDEKLVITLSVWSLAAVLYEFTPRDPDPETNGGN